MYWITGDLVFRELQENIGEVTGTVRTHPLTFEGTRAECE
jgi:hypothetical protein